MKRLWAPWRMELIRQPKSDSCFFCEYAAQQEDEKNLIIERAEHCFVIFNRYPYNNGHLMIVPYRHTGDLAELEAIERGQMMEYLVRWQTILQKVIWAQGFNIGMNLGSVAGAGVKDHVHMHIVPRWNGDTNYIPVLADTKIISQSLDELYQELKLAIANDE